MTRPLVALLAFVVAAAGCSTEQGGPIGSARPTPDHAFLSAGHNAFALELYEKLRTDESANLCVSPYGIYTLLCLAMAGAKGETASQTQRILRLPSSEESVHRSIGDWRQAIEWSSQENDQRFESANRLWTRQGLPMNNPFLDFIHDHYDGQAASLDFAGNPEECRLTINDWAAEATGHKIKDLIAPGGLDPQTMMLLTNAVYFKAAWLETFAREMTHDGDFHVSDTEVLRVPFMTKVRWFQAAVLDKFTVLSLPYKNRKNSMWIILPKDRNGLSQVEQEISINDLDSWRSEFKEREVVVQLPRFRIASDLDVAAALRALGLDACFSNQADFSGLTSSPGLFLNDIQQRAWIDVGEEGTEAAAATYSAVFGEDDEPEPPLEFLADHPFMFIIRDRETGTILFIGRVVRPEQ